MPLDPAQLLERFEVQQYPGVFVLGCFAQRITMRDQQVRALNLVDALLKTDRLRPDD